MILCPTPTGQESELQGVRDQGIWQETLGASGNRHWLTLGKKTGTAFLQTQGAEACEQPSKLGKVYRGPKMNEAREKDCRLGDPNPRTQPSHTPCDAAR